MVEYSGCRKELKRKFEEKYWAIKQEDSGHIDLVARTNNGSTITLYKNNKILIQGKNTKLDESILSEMLNNPILISNNTTKQNIFIVHGHDDNSRNELENILLRWGLNPVISMKEAGCGNSILENLFNHMDKCCFGIVLLTPDDEAYAKKEGFSSIKGRARQNVILEMGMLLSKMGKNKILTLRKNNTEIPSDIYGIIYTEYQNNISEIKDKIRLELKQSGFIIKD